MNQILKYGIGIIFSFCLMIVLLFTSIEAAIYWVPGYFEKEYTKYNVTDSVHMTMDDLLDVTDQMMAFLRGNREDLHVNTTMNGVEREFFNAREIAHMEDVRGLFLEAIALRRICLMIMVLCILALYFLKNSFKTTFPRSVCVGTGLFFSVSAIISVIISTDFTRYFIMFHHIFFKNDLWMLDPSTDMLINIVPEGFFRDTVLLIGLIYFFCVLITFAICLFKIQKYGKKRK